MQFDRTLDSFNKLSKQCKDLVVSLLKCRSAYLPISSLRRSIKDYSELRQIQEVQLDPLSHARIPSDPGTHALMLACASIVQAPTLHAS